MAGARLDAVPPGAVHRSPQLRQRPGARTSALSSPSRFSHDRLDPRVLDASARLCHPQHTPNSAGALPRSWAPSRPGGGAAPRPLRLTVLPPHAQPAPWPRHPPDLSRICLPAAHARGAGLLLPRRDQTPPTRPQGTSPNSARVTGAEGPPAGALGAGSRGPQTRGHRSGVRGPRTRPCSVRRVLRRSRRRIPRAAPPPRPPRPHPGPRRPRLGCRLLAAVRGPAQGAGERGAGETAPRRFPARSPRPGPRPVPLRGRHLTARSQSTFHLVPAERPVR